MPLNPITRVENFLARIAGDPGTVLTPITRIEKFLQRIIDTGGGGGGSVTVDSQLSLESENPVQNKIITAALNDKAGADATTQALSGKEDKPTETTVSGATPSIEPAANTIYKCGTLTSLTITSPPATGAWSVVFTSGSTATTTTIPSTILGLESFAAETNTIYEINVLDNRAVVGSWAVTIQ